MRDCKQKGISIQWFESVNELPAAWQEQLPAHHFLQRDTLLAHEEAHLPHLRTVYALLFLNNQVVGQAAFQVLSLQSTHISDAALKPWQRILWQAFTKVAQPKLLVAGQLFRHDIVSYHWQSSVTPFDAFQYYRQAIVDGMKKYKAQAILVKETPEELVPYFQHHAPQYLLLRNDSSMQLQLPAEWATFADYEKSLKHKYAQRLRKVRQSWQELEVRELSVAEVQAHADKIYQLYLQVTGNQQVRLGMLSKAFIPSLKAFYKDRLKVWGIFKEGEMIAFASAWVQDHSFDMFYIGFDYALNARLQLYFNILFFSIEQAIRLQKPQLILGRTALEAKARVGCKPQYLHTFLYIKNPLVRSAVSRLQQKFTEGAGEWENRHPFKQP